MFNEFLSQRPSAEGLYAAHVMFQELANGTYEHYCQQIRQEEQAGPQVGEENRWQIHDELPQQPFDDFQHGSHLLQQQSSVEVTYALEYRIFACVANPVQESSAQSTPNLDPNEQPMVPDAVFIAESGRPYDLFWMEKWNIAPQQFQDLRSRMKFTDLFDRGVLQWDHDVLHFNSVTSAGCEVKRRFVVCWLILPPTIKPISLANPLFKTAQQVSDQIQPRCQVPEGRPGKSVGFRPQRDVLWS